MIMHDQIIN